MFSTFRHERSSVVGEALFDGRPQSRPGGVAPAWDPLMLHLAEHRLDPVQLRRVRVPPRLLRKYALRLVIIGPGHGLGYPFVRDDVVPFDRSDVGRGPKPSESVNPANPVRHLVAPSGSYRSGGGGNEAVEPFETAGRFGGSASRQAATQVNAVQAPKQPDVEADPVAIRGRPPSWRQEGQPLAMRHAPGFHRGICLPERHLSESV